MALVVFFQLLFRNHIIAVSDCSIGSSCIMVSTVLSVSLEIRMSVLASLSEGAGMTGCRDI